MKRDNAYNTPEFKRRMSEKLKGNKNALGHTINWSPEWRKRFSDKLKGVKKSAETRLKMSLAKTGTKSNYKGKLHYAWKGENVSYVGLHMWIAREFGRADRCENKKCPEISKFYNWANLSGKYFRKRSDWVRLCCSCHQLMDRDKAKGKEIRKCLN